MYRRTIIAILMASCLLLGCSGRSPSATSAVPAKHAAAPKAVTPKLETYDGGFFSIQRPAGWSVKTAGRGNTLAFLVRDPSCSLRQVFEFTEVGPFYTNEAHKATEVNYMRSGGYPIAWIDWPVIQPLTTTAFFQSFSAIAQTKIAHGFMPDMPHLEDFKVISTRPLPSPAPGFSVELVRAVFKQDGKPGQGLFTAAVGVVQPYGWGLYATGITAPSHEFRQLEPTLVKTLQSFNLSQAYVQQCLREQDQNFKGLLKAGKTMSECADIIVNGWNERNKTDDIVAEKRSDSILGRDRYYDPSTGEVYYYPTGRTPSRPNLQEIPDGNYGLWMAPAHDGELDN